MKTRAQRKNQTVARTYGVLRVTYPVRVWLMPRVSELNSSAGKSRGGVTRRRAAVAAAAEGRIRPPLRVRGG